MCPGFSGRDMTPLAVIGNCSPEGTVYLRMRMCARRKENRPPLW